MYECCHLEMRGISLTCTSVLREDIELQADWLLDLSEDTNGACSYSWSGPIDPLPPGANSADFVSAKDLDSNAANIPLETDTHAKPSDKSSDPLMAAFGDSVPKEHDEFAWLDESFNLIPTREPVQVNQSSFGHPSGPTTSSPCENLEHKHSISTSRRNVPGDQLEGHKGLPRRRSRYTIQQFDHGLNAAFIPPSAAPSDPLERWKESPPEGEAASLSAIKDALEQSSAYPGRSQTPGTPNSRAEHLFRVHRRSASRAPSTTSGESATSMSSQRSNRSGLSALSNGSQAPANKTSSGVQKKTKKQAGANRAKRSSANNPRIFCCTFCCDKFKSKYDWMRHEKALHLNLETWVCTPVGGAVVMEATGRAHCAYCNQLDPSLQHLDQHNHGPCQQRMRTFRRKDHLLQHLRLFHHLETMPLVDDWKQVKTDFPSRCGFCDGRMSSWEERADHLTFHFRKGSMANWKGDHDFPPDITAQLTHSVPPYMLDFESRSFVPFSATNRDVNDHLSQMMSRAAFAGEAGVPQPLPEFSDTGLHLAQDTQLDSYTEVLTRHLSHFARHMMGSGIIPTDEMFQLEARRLLFDSEDQWNQTMADNHEWLASFRETQGSKGAVQNPE
ncbi:unnamed protein product [Penicillium olsonii]|uniref:C2H2-type domain-containing protein n=1 Tax=Penicillium olsonii TaxID=99116 RepID=A0A9W4HQ19_PENOL|nr:unnamed protein product [Penicillium olsonii]